MAIDKKLQIFNDEGNPVDYDILASDVKFNDGKDLPTKLDEMEDEIGEGGYTPPQGGIPKTDLAQSVQDTLDDVANKVDKVTGKGLSTNDYTTEEKTKLGNLPTNPVQSISVNGGTAQTPTNGNVNIEVQAGDKVSVIQPANPDGTFIIRVGSTDYTINLNHEHQGMAKLEKVTAATLPQTMANDTIYVQVDNLATPTEIEALYIFGLEFAGGGVPSGTPAITKPSGTTINLGTNFGSGVSKQIEIKANGHITGDLTVGLAANSDLSFDTTNLPSGVTYNSGEGALTIAQATAMQGVNITIVYSGSGAAEIAGGLIITGGGASPKSLIVEVVAPVALTAIKLTGTQWLQTDYYPNADTEFEMELKFSENSYTDSLQSVGNGIFLLRASNSTGSNRWDLNNGNNSTSDLWKLVMHLDAETVNTENITTTNHELLTVDHAIVKLIKTSSTKATFYFAGRTVGALNLKVGTTSLPLAIGYNYQAENSSPIYKAFDVTIYRLTITENGSTVRNYVPAALEGVPGLYDEINGEFISSKTESELVAIE